MHRAVRVCVHGAGSLAATARAPAARCPAAALCMTGECNGKPCRGFLAAPAPAALAPQGVLRLAVCGSLPGEGLFPSCKSSSVSVSRTPHVFGCFPWRAAAFLLFPRCVLRCAACGVYPPPTPAAARPRLLLYPSFVACRALHTVVVLRCRGCRVRVLPIGVRIGTARHNGGVLGAGCPGFVPDPQAVRLLHGRWGRRRGRGPREIMT